MCTTPKPRSPALPTPPLLPPLMHPDSSRPILPSPTPTQHVTQDVLGHGDKEGLELLPRRLDAFAGKYMCAVAAGEKHSLAVCARKGECFGWGSNSGNQLALEGYDGHREHMMGILDKLYMKDMYTQDHRTRPTRINELCNERVISVACSPCGSCAVTSQGEIWRWGRWNGLDLMPSPFKGTLLDSHRVIRYLFPPTAPISPICRTPLFPYLTFYSCFGQRRSQLPSLPGTHCRRCCLQLASQ